MNQGQQQELQIRNLTLEQAASLSLFIIFHGPVDPQSLIMLLKSFHNWSRGRLDVIFHTDYLMHFLHSAYPDLTLSLKPYLEGLCSHFRLQILLLCLPQNDLNANIISIPCPAEAFMWRHISQLGHTQLKSLKGVLQKLLSSLGIGNLAQIKIGGKGDLMLS